jgi:hypothetical protein
MAGQNFVEEDRLDTDAFNEALWVGLTGHGVPSTARTGLDLRANRKALLSLAPAICHGL